MHLVNEAIVFRINDRRAFKEFAQQSRPSRSIDSSESRDDAALIEHQFLRFEQDAARLAHRFCLALFRYPRAVALRVNAGAACKEQF